MVYHSCRAPDGGKIKEKMLYASTKDGVQKKFSGIQFQFPLSYIKDADYDSLANEVERRS